MIIEKRLFADLDNDDPIFRTLKEDYPHFIEWVQKKEWENIYVVQSHEKLDAVLYLKKEEKVEENVTPMMTHIPRMKIGMFKVAVENAGIGTNLMWFALQTAVEWKVDEVYVTVCETEKRHHKFMNFIEKFGFVFHGYRKNERVYTKKIN